MYKLPKENEDLEEGKTIEYVLIKCPFESLLHIAEKSKYKMPIAVNKTRQEQEPRKTSWWTNIFHSNLKYDYANKTGNNHDFITAPYTSDKRDK